MLFNSSVFLAFNWLQTTSLTGLVQSFQWLNSLQGYCQTLLPNFLLRWCRALTENVTIRARCQNIKGFITFHEVFASRIKTCECTLVMIGLHWGEKMNEKRRGGRTAKWRKPIWRGARKIFFSNWLFSPHPLPAIFFFFYNGLYAIIINDVSINLAISGKAEAQGRQVARSKLNTADALVCLNIKWEHYNTKIQTLSAWDREIFMDEGLLRGKRGLKI